MVEGMKAKTIRQTVTFKSSPEQVYTMIMDRKKQQSLSRERAEPSARR